MKSEWTAIPEAVGGVSYRREFEIERFKDGDAANAASDAPLRLLASIWQDGDSLAIEFKRSDAHRWQDWWEHYPDEYPENFDEAEFEVLKYVALTREEYGTSERFPNEWSVIAQPDDTEADRLWRCEHRVEIGGEERAVSMLIREKDAKFYPMVEMAEGIAADFETIILPPHKTFNKAAFTLTITIDSAAQAVSPASPAEVDAPAASAPQSADGADGVQSASPSADDEPFACAYCGAWQLENCAGYIACISRITRLHRASNAPPYTREDAAKASYRALREWEGEDIDELVAAAHWRPEPCDACGFIVCMEACPHSAERKRVAAVGEVSRALAKAALSAKDARRQLKDPQNPDEIAALATADAYLEWRASV